MHGQNTKTKEVKEVEVLEENTVKLEVIINPSTYGGIAESAPMAFGVAVRTSDRSFKEIKPEAHCRDFSGPVAITAKLKLDKCPYIERYSTSKDRLSTDEIVITLSQGRESLVRFMDNFHILNELEEDCGIPLTKAYLTNEVSSTFRRKIVIVGDKFWIQSPLCLSIFTWLLRCLSYSLPTKPSSLEELADLFIKHSPTSTDGTFWVKINPHVNVRLLLKNIVHILGDNPITGIDDNKIIHSTNYLSKIGTDAEYRGDYDKIKRGIFKNEFFHVNYCWDWNSASSYQGLISFVYLITKAKDGTFDKYKTSPQSGYWPYPGYIWVSNYLNLEKGIKVDTAIQEVVEVVKKSTSTVKKKEMLSVVVDSLDLPARTRKVSKPVVVSKPKIKSKGEQCRRINT